MNYPNKFLKTWIYFPSPIKKNRAWPNINLPRVTHLSGPTSLNSSAADALQIGTISVKTKQETWRRRRHDTAQISKTENRSFHIHHPKSTKSTSHVGKTAKTPPQHPCSAAATREPLTVDKCRHISSLTFHFSTSVGENHLFKPSLPDDEKRKQWHTTGCENPTVTDGLNEEKVKQF